MADKYINNLEWADVAQLFKQQIKKAQEAQAKEKEAEEATTKAANSSSTPKVTTSSIARIGSSAVDQTPVTSDVAEIYEVLAPMAGDYANAQAERIGMAQQSMGPLAAATMGTTTSGLGNYTYNRLMRPQVETMRDAILVQGYTNQLNKLLSDTLNQARKNYQRRVSSGGSTKKTTDTGDGSFPIEEQRVGDSVTPQTISSEVLVDGSEPGQYTYTAKNKVFGTTETGTFYRDKNGKITNLTHVGPSGGTYKGESADSQWSKIKEHLRDNSITYRRIN